MEQLIGKNLAGSINAVRFYIALALIVGSFVYMPSMYSWVSMRRTPITASKMIVSSPTNNLDKCFKERQWPFDLELFLPVPPSEHGLQELRLFVLPTLALFWPIENLRLLLLTDGEAEGVSLFADRLRRSVSLSGINDSVAKCRVLFNFPVSPHIKKGWDRQQMLMFWADNFTSSNYVGFIDSDTVFVTRVTKHDLFINDQPIVRALYGKPHDPNWWVQVPRVTFDVIGRLEPFFCMTYFPVIIKVEHLRLIREHIRQQLNKTTFDEAFVHIASRGIYSQFDIMCAYLWYYKRDDYYWIIGEREPGWTGPIAIGQVRNLAEAGINSELLTRQRPHLTIHWNYEHFRSVPGIMKNILATGVCYSMTDDDSMKPRYCQRKEIRNRTETFNIYEWTFEGYTFISNRSLNAHLERLKLIDQCPHEWTYKLVSDLTT